MQGFIDDIEQRTENNLAFRFVLYTGKHMQLVLMSLQPGDDIGEEVHDDVDQFFRIEKGNGEVSIDGRTTKIQSATTIIVTAGARHNIRNTGEESLQLYTIYAPPEHQDGTVQITKADAMTSSEHFDGVTTE